MTVVLVDTTSNSLLVGWPERSGAKRYVLQYKKGVEEAEFETLSDKLTTTQVRKRNLSDPENAGFSFRVGAIFKDTDDATSITAWETSSDPFQLLTADGESQQMEAPTVFLAGTNQALRVSWKARDGATKYELQMRENSAGADWKTLSSALTGTEVRKKNLTHPQGYQFRVRPFMDVDQSIPFSPPSESSVALGLSNGVQSLFKTLEDGKLMKKVGEALVPLADALGGKEFILLYASAHWCGPCRQFTPMLTRWYQSLGAADTKTVEVVFLSADHDENGFEQYYKSMPWLAVQFDDDTREQLMSYIRVTGIPRLVVLDGKTGRIIEDNAVGKPLDIEKWRQLVAK